MARATTCREGCGGEIQWAIEPASGRWIPLDVQVVDATDPAVWLARPGAGRLEAVRLLDVAEAHADRLGISEALARARVLDLFPAHFDHRQTCPVRQHREDKKR